MTGHVAVPCRGLTHRLTVPLASVMFADTRRYFDHLTRYRAGDADGFVEYVARAAIVSSEAAQDSARALAELPVYWRDIARPRSNSADEKIIDALTPRSVSAPSSTCNGSELGELGVDVDLDGTEDLEHVG